MELLNGQLTVPVPTPFKQNLVSAIHIHCFMPDKFFRKVPEWSGTIEIKQNDVSGKKEFNAQNHSELMARMNSFLTTLEK